MWGHLRHTGLCGAHSLTVAAPVVTLGAPPARLTLREPRRVAVVGTTGSGKTVLARRLAGILGARHVELDALHWEPGWVPAPGPVFRARVDAALTGDRWVCDGNYHLAREIVWGRANELVWLDYSLGLILFRLLKRTTRRLFTREELWNGNREGGHAFVGRDSLFLWALKTYWRRKREYRALLQDPAYRHLEVVRLMSPAETEGWVRRVACLRS